MTPYDSDAKDLLKNSTTVSVLTGLGVISGFLVNAVIAAKFGLGADTDAFFVAYTLPNMLAVFAHASFSWTLVPLFARRFTEESEESIWGFASIILNIGTIFFTLLALIGVLGAPLFIYLLAPGLDAETRLLAIQLSKISFLVVGFTAAIEVGMALLYARRSFVVPTILKFAANTVTLVIILIAGNTWGVTAIAVGYTLGEVCKIAVLITALFSGLRFQYHFLFDVNYPGVKEAGRLMFAPLTGSLMTQGTIIVERVISSFLPTGSISALGYASRINNMISGVFLGSLTTALLPSLSVTLKQGVAKTKQTLMTAFNFVSFISLPIGIAMIALSTPLVRLFFERGNFDPESTLLTGSLLSLYCIHTLFYGHYRVITAFFYAALEARKIVYLAACLMVCTIGLDLVLVQFFQTRGLALARSGGMVLSTTVGYLLLKSMFSDFNWKGLTIINTKIIAASALMGLVVYYVEAWLSHTIQLSNTLSQVLVLSITGVCGIATFIVIATLLRVEELRQFFNWAWKKLLNTGRLFPVSKM